MKSPIRICTSLTPRLVLSGCCSDLASEDAVAEERLEHHQGKDDDATPEHEHETGLRRGRFVDGDDEGDEVWPEGQRQRAECGQEDKCHDVERPVVVVI